ncbi:MAG: ABC transporter permease [Candidatus Acidiferrales bacterium]
MLIAWLNEIGARVRGLFRRRERDVEFDAELRAHFEMLVDDYRARGIGEAEARRMAHVRLGGAQQIKEAHREQRGLPLLDTFWQDLRYGFRQLRGSPGFTIVAVLTIALGIGVNAGIFSVLDALALRPIVVGAGQTVVSFYPIFQGKRHRNVHGSGSMFSYPEYEAYRDQNHVFSGLAGYVPFVEATVGGERPAQINGTLASCNYFDVLNERPVLGRGFVEADCAAAGASAVVVSNEYWQNELGADAEIVGKTISLNHTALTIVGVALAGFEGTEIAPSAFWAPITMQRELIPDLININDADLSWMAVLGSAKPGVSLEQVRAELAVITERSQVKYPGTMKIAVQKTMLFNRPEERGIILTVGAVVLCAVGLVLLIACANIANLLFARAAARRREIAVRLAMGASRGRLIRQLLTESILLALIGGTLGTFISFVSFDGLERIVIAHLPPGAPPFALHLSPDARVLGYSLLLTVLMGIAFGLAPALQSSREDVNTALKDEGGDAAGRSARTGKLRNVLVSGQVAVCMILLLAAGLLLRGLYKAQTIDPGFEMKGLEGVTFRLVQQGFSEAQAAALHRQMKERLAALPGVDAVAEARNIPLGDEHWQTGAEVPGGVNRQVSYNRVSPIFFAMMGIPIVRGRDFTEGDVQSNARVVIVTEAAAREFWPGEDPLGKSLMTFGEGNPLLEVVGVAKDAQVDHLGEAHPNFLYFPTDLKEESQDVFIVHSTLGDAATLDEIQSALQALDRQLSFGVARVEDNVSNFRAFSRIVVAGSGTLAGLALLLAAIGVYGLVSYAVSRRIREIGIRMALGADGRDVMKLILGQALRPVVIGALIGVVCCAGVSRIFSSLLFGVSPLDPISFVMVPVFLICVAGLACYVPVRRAMRVDPMVALRYK